MQNKLRVTSSQGLWVFRITDFREQCFLFYLSAYWFWLFYLPGK